MHARRTVARTLALAALADLSAAAARAASPYATELVSQNGAYGSASLYNDPQSVLGEPTRIIRSSDPATGFGPLHVGLVQPAFNRDFATGAKVVTTLGRTAISGGGYTYGSITVKFDHDVVDDPTNPYGIDLNVFGNAFYAGSDFASDADDLRQQSLIGGINAEPVVISVSPDNVNWYTYTAGPYGDTAFPTLGHAWSAQQFDATGNGWTGQPATDFTKPVNPTLNTLLGSPGVTLPIYDAMQTYVNAGGGTGIDLAASGFASVRYVRVESTAQFRDGEIDAFADVRPMRVGEAMSVTPGNVSAGTSLYFQSDVDPSRTAIRADFTSVGDLAKLSTATYADASALSHISGDVLAAFAIDVKKLIGDGSVTFSANLAFRPGFAYAGNGSDLSVLSWNGSAWTPVEFTFDAQSGLATLSGYSNPSARLAISVAAFTYALDTDSLYSNPSAFQPGGTLPTAGNGRVRFGNVITAPRTVTVDQAISLRSLTFDSAVGYTLAGTAANPVALDGGESEAAVTVRAGNHIITAPVVLASDTRFDVDADSSLSITGTLDGSSRSIAKLGGGTLSLPAAELNEITVSAGNLAISGTTPTRIRDLSVDAGGTLDIGSSALLLDYEAGASPLSRIESYTADARLTSSQLATSPDRAIGYLDSAAVGGVFAYGGEPVDPTTLIVAATIKGDATLDLAVTFDDLLAVARHYNGSGKHWYEGDFDDDRNVDFDDLLALARNYGGSALNTAHVDSVGQQFAAEFALAQALVPEPAIAGLLCGGAVVMHRRRRD